MNCPTCNYSLWNLRDRLCPECGTPFLPSQFRFVPGSVRFCCPFCDQPYYGTSPEGHLIPREFECVTCHQRVSMDAMVLLPTEGLQDAQTAAEAMPWLDNRRRFLSRWFATIGWAMATPAKLIRLTPRESSTWPAFGFFMVTTLVLQFALWIPFIVMFAVAGAFGPRTGGMMMAGFMAGPAAIAFLGTVVLFLLWLVVSHGLLRLGGPLEARMGRTAQCFFYAGGANILGAIPCLGFYFSVISWVWPAVSAILMIRQAQKVSAGRACFAVLTPPLFVITAGVVWIVAVVVPSVQTSIASAQAARTAAATAQSARTRTLLQSQATAGSYAQAVLDALRVHAGDPPPHIARLVADGELAPQHFVLSDFGSAKAIPVGPLDLVAFATAAPSDRRRELARLESALGPAPTAYRLGDFVFTYQGVDVNGSVGDPKAAGLWLFVAEVQEGTGPSPTTSLWIVGLNRGVVEAYTPQEFQSKLALQNTQRRSLGLPAIPDPATVKHVAPTGK